MPFYRYMGCSAHKHRQRHLEVAPTAHTVRSAIRHSLTVFYGDIVPGRQARGHVLQMLKLRHKEIAELANGEKAPESCMMLCSFPNDGNQQLP